nr:hypothetical protein [Tanacetum cinerariifolium]
MCTRSSTSGFFSPFEDPEGFISRRNRDEPSLLFNFEEINMDPINNQGPPPAGPIPQNSAPDHRTMEELCQLNMNGWGGPIAPVNIQATDFELKNHMIQQVKQRSQYHGLPAQRGESSRSITFSYPEIAALTQQIAQMTKNFLRMSQSNQQVNVVNPSFETYGGPHHYSECQAVVGFTQGDVYAATGNYNMGGATQQLSSRNSFALTVAKYSSSGIFITSSRNALEH